MARTRARGWGLGNGGGVHLIAFEDTTTPRGGTFFSRFVNESVTLNEKGQLAFLADVSDVANGAATGRGLFVYDPAAGLQEIASTGDTLNGSSITGLGYTGTSFAPTQSVDTSFDGMNGGGKVGFAFKLATTQSEIAVWTPPTLKGDYNYNGVVDAGDYTT
jgi:hypothetical protein